MLIYNKEATIKSVYVIEAWVLTIYYYIGNQYCEAQIELTEDEIQERFGHTEPSWLIRQSLNITIQFFEDSFGNEMSTIELD
jgi:hypothetical protein